MGGYSWWGCATRFSKSWPCFQTKKVIIHTLFQTCPLKYISVFRPGGLTTYISLGHNYVIITGAHNLSIINHVLPFLAYSFRMETTNKFMHSRRSFENHARFQTRIGKFYIQCTRCQIKRRKNHTLFQTLKISIFVSTLRYSVPQKMYKNFVT